MKNNSIVTGALATTLLWTAADSFAPVYHSTQQQASATSLRSSILADDVIKGTTSNDPLSTVADMNDEDITAMMRNDNPPLPGTIMKMLPKDTFQVDTATSLMYAGLDVAAVVGSMSFLYAVVQSDFYNGLPIAGQALTVAPLQILTGFAMWCTWCIGHDAGHGTVSKSTKFGKGINRIV
eukprot:scaffold3801_cov124-Skeletonema_dohrnii-CCMP3373.AAC.1